MTADDPSPGEILVVSRDQVEALLTRPTQAWTLEQLAAKAHVSVGLVHRAIQRLARDKWVAKDSFCRQFARTSNSWIAEWKEKLLRNNTLD